jgi:hypothetical protein
MRRTAVLKRIAKAARTAGVEFSTLELTNHTGLTVGAVRTTIGRHGEISEGTAEALCSATTPRTGKGTVATVMQEFTSTARKDGRWWVVQCDQHPGAISQVARLDQAQEHQREAIAFVAGLSQEVIAVTVRTVLDPGITLELEQADRLRREAESAARLSAERRRHAALAMKAAGLTVRDMGAVLRVSHQRAHQLVSSK